MDVLHVNIHLARRGGVETYLLALLPLLAERGVRSTWVYREGDPELYAPSISMPELGEVGFTRQGAVRRAMDRLLQRERPDLVHIHNIQNIGVLKACLDYGPTIVTTHDYRWVCPANTFFYKRTQEICHRTCGLGCFAVTARKHCLTPRPQYAGYFYYRTKWVIQNSFRFSRVLAPSTGAKERLEEVGFPNTDVLPCFCPLTPEEEPRELPDRPTITYIGRIAPNKGQHEFIRALGLLPPEVQGVMVGSMDGDERAAMIRLAREHGCLDRLGLRPWATRKQVVEILDGTSVFIFPSLWPETLGIVGLEAMSRGVPVVASDVGGVDEWLQDGENGYLVSPKNPDEISDRVLRLLNDPRRMEEFGRAGIATINEKFLPSTHADSLVHVYEQSLGAVAA